MRHGMPAHGRSHSTDAAKTIAGIPKGWPTFGRGICMRIRQATAQDPSNIMAPYRTTADAMVGSLHMARERDMRCARHGALSKRRIWIWIYS